MEIRRELRMIPSASQYNSRSSFVNQILVAIAGRAAEEIVSGTSECTAGAQQILPK